MVKNRLKELREKRGLSQRELSKITNVNHVTISRLETGITSFNDEYIEIFTKFFGVTSDYLIGIDDRVAFFREDNSSNLTEEQIESIQNLISFYKEKNKR